MDLLVTSCSGSCIVIALQLFLWLLAVQAASPFAINGDPSAMPSFAACEHIPAECEQHAHALAHHQAVARVWRSRGGVSSQGLHSIGCHKGCTHIKVVKGELYVTKATKGFQSRIYAHLLMLYRALAVFPLDVDVEALIVSEDLGFQKPVFSMCQRYDYARRNPNFRLPPFLLMAWPEVKNPPWQTMYTAMANASAAVPWEKKHSKALFRGNRNSQLRTSLLQKWSGPQHSDVLDVMEVAHYNNPIELARVFVPPEFWCDYKVLIYAEGTTCAGRLPMMAMCDSLIVSTPPEYEDMTLPFLTPGVDIHCVSKDWSDLKEVVTQLMQNKTAIELAQRRGERMRRLLSQRGLACYLRQALACWSTTQRFTVSLDEQDVPLTLQLMEGMELQRLGEVRRKRLRTAVNGSSVERALSEPWLS